MASATDISSMKLTPSQVTEAINKMLRINQNNAAKNKKRKPLFVWGPPGVGKSSIFEQVCKASNLLLIDVRLTQMEPTDLRGIPVPVSKQIVKAVDNMVVGVEETEGFLEETVNETHVVESVEVHWAIPGFLPKINTDNNMWDGMHNGHKYDGFILLLDELPNAAPSVQAGSYQLVLDGALGEYIVPSNGVVFAAGNRETDKGGTYKMPLPLVNRFCHIEMESNFKEWQRIAIIGGYNEKVIGYLSAHEGMLFEFNPKSADRGFPTPRSWEMVSDILNDEEANPGTSRKVQNALISGAVGSGVAVDFIVHCETSSSLPDAGDILDGKLKDLPRELQQQTALCYTLTIKLCHKLQGRFKAIANADDKKEAKKAEDLYYESVDNFLEYIMKNFRPEMNVLGVRIMIHMYDLDTDMERLKNWDVFIDKYADMIAEA